MQTLAIFALCSAQIGPCWPIWPLSGRLARFPLPHATRCNQRQSQENRLVFEYANDNIHLPKNPLGLMVNGLCFSPDNVFSIRCISLTGNCAINYNFSHENKQNPPVVSKQIITYL